MAQRLLVESDQSTSCSDDEALEPRSGSHAGAYRSRDAGPKLLLPRLPRVGHVHTGALVQAGRARWVLRVDTELGAADPAPMEFRERGPEEGETYYESFTAAFEALLAADGVSPRGPTKLS